jgi:ATP-dependent DNA helicase RecQ
LNSIAFFDCEVSFESGIILDIGATRSDSAVFHKNSASDFFAFIKDCQFWCGHNIIQHDLVYLRQQSGNPGLGMDKAIDTLLLSPLLFPRKPYHKLLKDDKLQTEERNNPYNDALKARDLFLDEVVAFGQLEESLKTVFYHLLYKAPGYGPFFRFVEYKKVMNETELEVLIRDVLKESICEKCNLGDFIQKHPIALAYTLSLISSNDRYSITPPWVLKN